MIVRKPKTKEIKEQVLTITTFRAPADVVAKINKFGKARLARQIGVSLPMVANAINEKVVLPLDRYEQILKILGIANAKTDDL